MPDRDDEDEYQSLIDGVNSHDPEAQKIAVGKAIKLLLQERRDRAMVIGWLQLVTRYALAVAAGSLILQQFSHQIRDWIQAWLGTVK